MQPPVQQTPSASPTTGRLPVTDPAPVVPGRPAPDLAWQELLNGNGRFLSGEPLHPGQDAARRAEIADDQRPFALVFGCSDSRVAAEIIFDQGLGDLFVVRTAGHVVDAGVIGSVEYGVHALKIGLIVVLGHDNCGLVRAATESVRTGTPPPGYIRDVTERITPAVLSVQRSQHPPDLAGAHAPLDYIETEHVRGTAKLLVERSRILGKSVKDRSCLVVGATYRLADGRVRLVSKDA
jgi:carbonic anhydrase